MRAQERIKVIWMSENNKSEIKRADEDSSSTDLLCCPHCQSTEGVEYKDYGYAHVYHETFDGKRECVNMISKTPPPVFGKCIYCNRQIRLSKMELRNQ